MGGMNLFRDRRFFSERLLSGAAVSGVLLFIFGVTGGAVWTINRVESAVREGARRNLTTVLATAHEAAKHWATRQQGLAASVAANRELGQAAEQAVESWRRSGKAGPAGAVLDSLLASAVRTNSLAGYWIVGDEERPIHRWPESLSEQLPASMQDAVAKALDGLPALSPFPGDPHSKPQLTAVAPIRNTRGEAVAVLALVLPVEQELDQVAEQSHNRSLGQTYFFDRSGLILGSSAMSRVVQAEPILREPGSQELTRMAREAIRGQPGIDLEGYRDHRGVRVVGAWEWDDQLGLGLAVESDASEVYRVSNTARKAILIGLAMTLLLFLTVLFSVVQARRRAEAMSAIQRRLAAVLETTTDPVCFADRAGQAIYLNDAGHALLGGGNEKPARGAPPPQWSQLLLRSETLAYAAAHGSWLGESTILTVDGHEITLSQVILCHRQRDGEVDFYSTIVRDITDRKQLERRLRDEKERAEVTLGSIGDAVVRADAKGLVEYLNPVAEQLLGAPTSELAGRHIADVLSLVHETTREALENPVETCLREGRIVGRSNLSLLVRPDGREFAIDDSAAPIRDAEGDVIGAVLVFHDVSRARTLARQLAHQASHDFLTGLVNRHEFERRVGRALQRAQQEAVTHALCFLDLDQFKVVNDTCGHGAGDELLRQLANALQKKVRRRDTLARLGGDEFGVLLEHCTAGQATRVANELLEAVQEFRFVWEGKPFALGVSIGVVPITGESESLAVVLRDADAACYAAKERGRNRVHFYEANDAAMALRQGEMQWVSRITSALEENRFRLYGQAIVPLVPRQGERARVEVLLRMVERNGDLIAPGAFIPAAERYNLMGAVDRWVVREVVSLYAAHQASGWQPIASINLSGASLGDPSMLAYVRDQLARNDLSPETLCFEITETAAIANLGLAAHFIRELKSMGCWFALDDFGSGMSSFAYLQSLPVDSLKIAGAFLRHIETDPVEYAMVEAIHRVGHVMRLKTVAEGVESLDTLETLRRIGVDYAQGYAIAEPRPLEELVAIAINPSRGAERQRPASHPGAPRSRQASVSGPS
jgi:diguanylate cyclase (GGDEF)-like protein/PAS domain S-box-containing protein